MSEIINIYLKQNINLAKSLVIKSEDSAVLINEYLKNNHANIIISSDKSTWKYYLNLSGEYHETDKMMTVISADTYEEIEFTKENLKTHTATHKLFSYGTREYYSLLHRYQDQEQLILSILNPTDIDYLLSEPDHRIVNYNKNLVEEQEYSLINSIQTWLNNYLHRWNVRAYHLSDSLYFTSFYALLYLQLPQIIFTERLKRAKTPEAHSFHIKNYLASHGGLDRYYKYLNLKQKLFLYRNIAYLERNNGKQEIFEWLIDELLTERKIPISEHEIQQTDNFENRLPETLSFRRILNEDQNSFEKKYITIDELRNKEYSIARDNSLINYKDIENKLSMNKHSRIKTKNLESVFYDYSDYYFLDRTEFMVNYWGFLSHHNKYHAYIRIVNPKTKEPIVLKANDMFLLMLYVLSEIYGEPLEKIPTYYPKYILSFDDKNITRNLFSSEIKDYREVNYINNTYPSITSFNSSMNDLFDVVEDKYKLMSFTNDISKKAEYKALFHQMFRREETTLSSNYNYETMDEFLSQKNLDFNDYGYDDYNKLLKLIVDSSLGLNPDELTMYQIQNALLDMFMELSSYSIHMLRNKNIPLEKVGLPVAGLSLHGKESKSSEKVTPSLDLDVGLRKVENRQITSSSRSKLLNYNNKSSDKQNLTNNSPKLNGVDNYTFRERLIFKHTKLNEVTITKGDFDYVRIDDLVDVYGHQTENNSQLVNIKDIVLFDELPGFTHPSIQS